MIEARPHDAENRAVENYLEIGFRIGEYRFARAKNMYQNIVQKHKA